MTMPEEYERRVFVKDGRERISATRQDEIGLRWSGWLPADEAVPAADPPAEAETPTGFAEDGLLLGGVAEVGNSSEQDPATIPKRSRTKTAE
jgi:hypothetical protein